MVGQKSATEMNTTPFNPQILPDRAVVRVAGPTALAFLHNILTPDLTSQRPAYGALLSPQGKILNDLFIIPDGEQIWLDVATAQSADLLKRLIMYRLRAKLVITVDVNKAIAVSPAIMSTRLCYVDPRLAAMGYRGIVDVGTISSGSGYHALRLAHGLADSQDIGSGEHFVHEANLDQLQGVSFSKGCYVGQEVVSRTHHKAAARNRMLQVSFEGTVAHGADIVSGEKRVGTMLSSLDGRGLALLRLDRLAECTSSLLAGASKVAVQKQSWAAFEVIIPESAR
jgi:tRNA-modifying protein YgfZ